jgi:phytanoyl-CoA hydroxylase
MKLLEKFKTNGYIICKGIVDIDLLDNHLSGVYSLYNVFNKPSKELEKKRKPWESQLFHKELIEFRKKKPGLFSCFYDSLQNCSSLTSLVFSDSLINMSAKLLGIKKNQLIAVAQQTRADVPNDKRNALNWHQDWSYFPTTKEALTLWFPLYEMTDKSGYLQILSKSHRTGIISGIADKIDETKFKKKNYAITHQKKIPDAIINTHETKDVKITRGDVVFFDTCLSHRSGQNTSNNVRFSCQNRLQNSTAKDYVPFRVYMKENPYIKNKLL